MPEKILIVDDEPNYLLVLEAVLEGEGYGVLTAGSGEEAFGIFSEDPEVDLVLTDMTMPNGNGIELLERVRGARPEVPVIMITAHGTIELAVQAMKQGAFDYLTKPFNNEDLFLTVAKAMEVSRLGRQNKELKEALKQRHSFGSLIGKSKAMLELYALLEKVAPTRANVLVTGESGTGKELVARAIHFNSPRRDGPFVAVNCSALASTLLESELFGHEKGAFTGAVYSRAGRFENAFGGTLFLDEVGEMGQDVQVKLLRVIQERVVERVGGSAPLSVDVRLVAATNRDLKGEMEAGRFRDDLFYRLNVVHIPVPPLRDRLDDLPILISHFLEKHSQGAGAANRFHQDALRLMYAYRWPGNVRELENVVERGLVLAGGAEILPGDLPQELQGRPDGAPASPSRPAAPPSPPAGHGGFPPAPPPGDGGAPWATPPGGGPGSAAPAAAGSPGLLAGEGHWSWKALAVCPPGGGVKLEEALAALKYGLILRAMEAAGNVQSRAAEALGLRRNTFKYMWDNLRMEDLNETLGRGLAGLVPEGERLSSSLVAFEEAMLYAALERCGFDQSRAAGLLGLKKRQFDYRVEKSEGLKSLLDGSA